MIIDLPDTDTTRIAAELVTLRETGGVVALGRVLTLVVVAAGDPEQAIEAANVASMEHPCRVIALAASDGGAPDRLDAEIRVGADAGASEVVVLRPAGAPASHLDALVTPLLLADAPVVAWWPTRMPASPAADPIGAMALRRVTDTKACPRGREHLADLRTHYRAGDTDLAWTRITRWRAQLAAALDSAPFDPVDTAVVAGRDDHPSVDLLAAWLAVRLGCPVRIERLAEVEAVTRVELHRSSGPIVLDRPDGSDVATLSRPGERDQRIPLAMRSLPECLAEELRRLDPDEIYAQTLVRGLGLAKEADRADG